MPVWKLLSWTTCCKRWSMQSTLIRQAKLMQPLKMCKTHWTGQYKMVFVMQRLMTCTTTPWLKHKSQAQRMLAKQRTSWMITLIKSVMKQRRITMIKLHHSWRRLMQFMIKQSRMVYLLQWRRHHTWILLRKLKIHQKRTLVTSW